jgi:hypothetical protein
LRLLTTLLLFHTVRRLLGLPFTLAALLGPPALIIVRRQARLAGLSELVAVSLLLIGPGSVAFALRALLLCIL